MEGNLPIGPTYSVYLVLFPSEYDAQCENELSFFKMFVQSCTIMSEALHFRNPPSSHTCDILDLAAIPLVLFLFIYNALSLIFSSCGSVYFDPLPSIFFVSNMGH